MSVHAIVLVVLKAMSPEHHVVLMFNGQDVRNYVTHSAL